MTSLNNTVVQSLIALKTITKTYFGNARLADFPLHYV